MDVYERLERYAQLNRSYAGIADLLNRTAAEYGSLMRKLGLSRFEDLVWRLRLKRVTYPWMKFKTELGLVGFPPSSFLFLSTVSALPRSPPLATTKSIPSSSAITKWKWASRRSSAKPSTVHTPLSLDPEQTQPTTR